MTQKDQVTLHGWVARDDIGGLWLGFNKPIGAILDDPRLLPKQKRTFIFYPRGDCLQLPYDTLTSVKHGEAGASPVTITIKVNKDGTEV